MKKQILMIVGSTRKDSFNQQLADKIVVQIADAADVTFLDYSDVPFMNQDIEFPAPEAVARVRDAVQAADGLWIVSPEYNFSYPAVVKNLLDWLSRPLVAGDYSSGTAILGKKVTVSGAAGKSAAAGCRKKLGELLIAIKADQMTTPETGIALGMDAFATNTLTLTADNEKSIADQIAAFLKFIGA
ncbi:MAG: NADPH-dependent FMN reductase [Peptococcaceae bacterium]|nr:NADPH-dependent FMN reductase [Peptococcaceae bacterium]